MKNTELAPPDLVALLGNAEFASKLPPLGNGAKQLLAFKDDDREDPRLLSLVAQKDPVHLGRILSLANSAAYFYPGVPVTTAESAVRRLGVRDTYAVLLACAMSASFPEQVNLRVQRRYLLNYTVSVCLTAKKLATWLRIDESRSAYLNLGALLTSAGLYAGMLAGGSVADRFKTQLANMHESADLRKQPMLQGFCLLSEQVARRWKAPEPVLEALHDSAKPNPETESGILLSTVEALVHAKATGTKQWSLVQVVESTFNPAKPANEETDVDLGVYVT